MADPIGSLATMSENDNLVGLFTGIDDGEDGDSEYVYVSLINGPVLTWIKEVIQEVSAV
jgi:hypothetical protein